MKNGGSHLAIATADMRVRSGEAASDISDAHQLNLARALRLGQLLRARVLIDEGGWLRGDIEIAYQRERGNTIRPITIRVGLETRDDEVLADGGPVARCRRYNAAITKLGQLGLQLAENVRAGRVTIRPGSPIAEAHRELDGLDARIAARQGKHMGPWCRPAPHPGERDRAPGKPARPARGDHVLGLGRELGEHELGRRHAGDGPDGLMPSHSPDRETTTCRRRATP